MGLVAVVLLEPRAHHGPMLGRVERAVLCIGDVGRVHICRYGEGASHMH
jgi:hypothetical protein